MVNDMNIEQRTYAMIASMIREWGWGDYNIILENGDKDIVIGGLNDANEQTIEAETNVLANIWININGKEIASFKEIETDEPGISGENFIVSHEDKNFSLEEVIEAYESGTFYTQEDERYNNLPKKKTRYLIVYTNLGTRETRISGFSGEVYPYEKANKADMIAFTNMLKEKGKVPSF